MLTFVQMRAEVVGLHTLTGSVCVGMEGIEVSTDLLDWFKVLKVTFR